MHQIMPAGVKRERTVMIITSGSNKSIWDILNAIRDGRLIPTPPFQRRLVWTNKDKREFIDTVLKGYPFPEIYTAQGDINLETGTGTELLVDGQQRVTTLQQYFEGSRTLRLGKDTSGKDFPRYAELSDEQKRQFLTYVVVVRNLGQISMEEIKEVFKRINATSYSLNK